MFPLIALSSLSVCFAAYDAVTRTLPLWLTLPAFALALLGWALHLWPWSPLAALIGFLAFRLADLPVGDQKAMAVVAGFLTPLGAALAVLLAFLAGTALLLVGRRSPWQTVNWPFFPWVAGAVLCARMLA